MGKKRSKDEYKSYMFNIQLLNPIKSKDRLANISYKRGSCQNRGIKSNIAFNTQ